MQSETTIRTSAPSYGRTPRALLRDGAISARAKSAYAVLDDYADTEGKAFPSRPTLARSLGCSVDSVDRAIAELETSGWLGRTTRKKDNRSFKSTLYSLEWSPTPNRTRAATPQSHPCGDPSRTGADTLAAPVPTEEEPLEEEPLEEELLLTADASSDPTAHDLFEAFWKFYPRKTGKILASKAFTKATKATAPSHIIEGVRRLAVDPNLPEKKFIPHPTTWLARGGWDDEPFPPLDKSESRAGIGAEYNGVEKIMTGAEWMEPTNA